MLYPKSLLIANYLRRVAGAVSPREKAFETAKKDALQSLKYCAEQIHMMLNRMDVSKLEPVKDKGKYHFKNDATGELQHHVDMMKRTFDDLAEKYQDLKDKEEKEEQDKADAEYGK
jgi:hypothetical protein